MYFASDLALGGNNDEVKVESDNERESSCWELRP